MIPICKNVRKGDHGQIKKNHHRERMKRQNNNNNNNNIKAESAKSFSKETGPKGTPPGSPAQVG